MRGWEGSEGKIKMWSYARQDFREGCAGKKSKQSHCSMSSLLPKLWKMVCCIKIEYSLPISFRSIIVAYVSAKFEPIKQAIDVYLICKMNDQSSTPTHPLVSTLLNQTNPMHSPDGEPSPAVWGAPWGSSLPPEAPSPHCRSQRTASSPVSPHQRTQQRVSHTSRGRQAGRARNGFSCTQSNVLLTELIELSIRFI